MKRNIARRANLPQPDGQMLGAPPDSQVHAATATPPVQFVQMGNPFGFQPPPAFLALSGIGSAYRSSVAGLARNQTESGTVPSNAGLTQSFRQPKFSQVFCHTIQGGRRKDHCLFEF
jgi:hypothetical protein